MGAGAMGAQILAPVDRWQCQNNPELTIVVPFKNVSAYNGNPPVEGESRKIASGPLYDLVKIKAMTMVPGSVNFWTRKCRHDAANLNLDTGDVGALIRELAERDYRDSEWCDDGKGAWAACDAYKLTRKEFNTNAEKWYQMEYFLKFAESRNGALVLIVSCHTST